MTLTHLQIAAVILATFLVGVNLALLMEFWDGLASWFTLKVLAVMGLLVYVVLSAFLGDPSSWRMGVGIVACLLDVWAFYGVWNNLREAKVSGEDLNVYRHR